MKQLGHAAIGLLCIVTAPVWVTLVLLSVGFVHLARIGEGFMASNIFRGA